MEPVLPVDQRQAAFEAVVRVLNEAFAADPYAMHSLVVNQVPCNQTLADHPTVQVSDTPLPYKARVVGMLGVVNGVVTALTGEIVATEWTEPDPTTKKSKMIGFCRYTPKETP